MTQIRKRIIFDESEVSLLDEYDVDIEEQAKNRALRMMLQDVKKYIKVSPLNPDDLSVWIATLDISGVNNG